MPQPKFSRVQGYLNVNIWHNNYPVISHNNVRYFTSVPDNINPGGTEQARVWKPQVEIMVSKKIASEKTKQTWTPVSGKRKIGEILKVKTCAVIYK